VSDNELLPEERAPNGIDGRNNLGDTGVVIEGGAGCRPDVRTPNEVFEPFAPRHRAIE